VVLCYVDAAIDLDPCSVKQQAWRSRERGQLNIDTAAAEECVWPRRHPLIEEGEDKVHGDLDDEFSVLVSLEEFMKKLRSHCGRTDGHNNGIFDLLFEMLINADIINCVGNS
jgi:hypothetical protein